MSTVGKLYQSGLLELPEGKINERLPPIQDGLVYHFPFDGNSNAMYNIENSVLKVLDYSYNYTSWSMKLNLTNGNIATGILTPNEEATVEEALQYDMVVCDQDVWAINQDKMSSLKDMADAGCTVWCTGNDTLTNVFVKTVTLINDKTITTGTIFSGVEEYIGDNTSGFQIETNSVDPNYYISEFQDGLDIIPLYYHDFVGPTGIMGYLYLPKNSNGGSLFFDLFGRVTVNSSSNFWLKYLLTLQLNRKQKSNLIINETSVSHTYRGVAVESSTTNYIPDGDFSGGLQIPYTSFRNGSLEIRNDYEHGEKMLHLVNSNVAGEGYTEPYSGGNPLTTANLGDIWTASFLVKAETPDTTVACWIMEQDSSGYYLTGSYKTSLLQPEDGWVPVQHTRTLNNASVANVTSRIDIDTPLGVVNIRNWQLEKTPYATSFVNGSRSSNGYVNLDNTMFPLLEGTVTMKIKFDGHPTIKTSPYVLQIGGWSGPIVKDCLMIYRGTGWDAPSDVLRFQLICNSIQQSKRSEIAGINALIDHEFYIGMSYSASAHTYRVFVYDLDTKTFLYNSGTVSWPDFVGFADFGTTINYLGSSGTAQPSDVVIRDFSIYHKYLSEDELLKLLNTSTSFQADGDLITQDFKEKPIIPGSASKYFPFGDSAKDVLTSIEPVTELNTVYEKRGVFIGSGTTNLITSVDWNAQTGWIAFWSSQTKTIETTDLLYSDSYVIKSIINDTLTGGPAYKDVIVPTTTAGIVFTISAYVKSIGRRIRIWSVAGTSSYSNYNTANNNWERIETQVESDTTGSIRVHFLYEAGAIGDIVWVTAPQLEQKAYVTPFIDGTISQSNLFLPYEIIDCKIDFTIFGWWYPLIYADGFYRPCLVRNPPNANSTYNRILIMGAGPASNQLRCWHGSDGVAESSVLAPIEIPVIENEWNFFALVRSGANMLLYIGNSGGFGSNSTATAYRLDEDETGQVWQVGEYSNSESDAYHRDYTFIQQALSSDELESIFKNNMSIHTNNLRVSYEIREV